MKRETETKSAVNLDADILECKAELQQLRQRLGSNVVNVSKGKTSGNTAEPKPNLNKIKIIEVKPLSKTKPSEKEAAKIPSFDELANDNQSELTDKETDLSQEEIEEVGEEVSIVSTNPSEKSAKELESEIKKKLISNSDSVDSSNSKPEIPVFDLGNQMLARERKVSSAKRVAPVARRKSTEAVVEKRGIEAVVEKGIGAGSTVTNINRISEKAGLEDATIKPQASEYKKPVAEEMKIEEMAANSIISEATDPSEEAKALNEKSDLTDAPLETDIPSKLSNAELGLLSVLNHEEREMLRFDVFEDDETDIELKQDGMDEYSREDFELEETLAENTELNYNTEIDINGVGNRTVSEDFSSLLSEDELLEELTEHISQRLAQQDVTNATRPEETTEPIKTKEFDAGISSRLEKNYLSGQMQQIISDIVSSDITRQCEATLGNNVRIVRYAGV